VERLTGLPDIGATCDNPSVSSFASSKEARTVRISRAMLAFLIDGESAFEHVKRDNDIQGGIIGIFTQEDLMCSIDLSFQMVARIDE
jgi:hypothetical protein